MGAEFKDNINYEEVFAIRGQTSGGDAGRGGNADHKDTAAADKGGSGEKAQALKDDDTGADNSDLDDSGEDGLDGEGGDSKGDPDAGDGANKEPGKEADKKPLTKEERAANAARRRQKEVDDAVAKAIAGADSKAEELAKKAVDDFIRKAGINNPITGKPLADMAEYEAYQQQVAEQQLQKNLKSGKLTKEDLDAVVSAHPAVKKATEIVAQAEQQQKALMAQRMKDEMAKITELDPTIVTAADLVLADKDGRIRALIADGKHTLLEAFKEVRGPEIEKQKTLMAKQQALNLVNSKSHLSPTNSRGAGAVTVPADEMHWYRIFNPNATEADIQKHFNSNKKK